MSNSVAAPGHVFVCLACGKTSRDRYGDLRISPRWDESCMMNSEEIAESRLVYEGGLVVEVKGPE